MHFSIDRTVHTTAFDKPVVDHWLEWKIAQTAAGSTETVSIKISNLLICFYLICLVLYFKIMSSKKIVYCIDFLIK